MRGDERTATLVLAEQTTAVGPQRLGACVGRLSLHEMVELDTKWWSSTPHCGSFSDCGEPTAASQGG
ncbi:MAG: hypothetical protein ACRDTD_18215 [Pseudonocardiaceae bacterium]